MPLGEEEPEALAGDAARPAAPIPDGCGRWARRRASTCAPGTIRPAPPRRWSRPAREWRELPPPGTILGYPDVPPPSSLAWGRLDGELEVEGAELPWPEGERRTLRIRLRNTGFARWLAGERGPGGVAVVVKLFVDGGGSAGGPPLARPAARPRAGRGGRLRDRGPAAAGPGPSLDRAPPLRRPGALQARRPALGATAVKRRSPRNRRAGPCSASLLPTLVGALRLDRAGRPSLVGDEATYAMQAASLAWDLDLAYSRAGLRPLRRAVGGAARRADPAEPRRRRARWSTPSRRSTPWRSPPSCASRPVRGAAGRQRPAPRRWPPCSPPAPCAGASAPPRRSGWRPSSSPRSPSPTSSGCTPTSSCSPPSRPASPSSTGRPYLGEAAAAADLGERTPAPRGAFLPLARRRRSCSAVAGASPPVLPAPCCCPASLAAWELRPAGGGWAIAGLAARSARRRPPLRPRSSARRRRLRPAMAASARGSTPRTGFPEVDFPAASWPQRVAAAGQPLLAPGGRRRARADLAPRLERALLPGRAERRHPPLLPAAPARASSPSGGSAGGGRSRSPWRVAALAFLLAPAVQLLRRRRRDRQPLLPAALSGALVPGRRRPARGRLWAAGRRARSPRPSCCRSGAHPTRLPHRRGRATTAHVSAVARQLAPLRDHPEPHPRRAGRRSAMASG